MNDQTNRLPQIPLWQRLIFLASACFVTGVIIAEFAK